MKNNIFFFLLIFFTSAFGQNGSQTPAVQSFKERVVVYSDFGYNSAPFRLEYPFSGTTNSLRFKNNYSPSLGLGVAHKWFAIRLNFALNGTKRAQSRYGQTKAVNLGLNFQVKRVFFDFDFRFYKGYAIKNANKWNDTLNDLKPNDLRPNTSTVSISFNAWLFKNKEWRMDAFNGQKAHFVTNCATFFLKPTLSIFGLSNEQKALIPNELQKNFDSKTQALSLSSLEFGVIPGYARVNRIENWQFGGFFGLGGVIQAKSYALKEFNRSFLGLSPRADFRFAVGYSNSKFFSFLIGDFENKSIRFNKLKYKQTYYSLRISVGYRFVREEKKKNKV
ncbi:MAG: DUF4421 domain-containing protein [Bacteroidetes bacterium]|nr:DUF4421 domain-containing protein [Bacteroidota bacterium]